MESPDSNPVFDAALGESKTEQLAPTDHPMLGTDQRPGILVSPFRDCPRHSEDKFGAGAESPPPGRTYLPGPDLPARFARYAAAVSAPAALRRASARSVRSQVKSSSARPKWP